MKPTEFTNCLQELAGGSLAAQKKLNRFFTNKPQTIDQPALAKYQQQAVEYFKSIVTQNYQNNLHVCAYLGIMHLHGWGVAKDDDEALRWIRLSAEKGNAVGQSRLGYMFLTGRSVTKNYQEAVKWFCLSAEQGYELGQYNLGLLYETGQGVDKNHQKAVECYRLSAEQGNVWAQYRLGICYRLGLGLTQSNEEAVKWFQLSANQDYAPGQSDLGFMYQNGHGVRQSYSEAIKWYRLSAEQGHALAQNNLGHMYLVGKGVNQNYQEAAKFYSLSAEQGNADGQQKIGWMYESIFKDYDKAIEWYQKAAAQGNSVAQTSLALMYYDSKDAKGIIAKATGLLKRTIKLGDSRTVALLQKAASQGNARAQNSLGCVYRDGDGVATNYAKAIELFKKSAEQGNAEAQNNLGSMYETGRGVHSNIPAAIYWYLKALNQSHQLATANLNRLSRENSSVKGEVIKQQSAIMEEERLAKVVNRLAVSGVSTSTQGQPGRTTINITDNSISLSSPPIRSPDITDIDSAQIPYEQLTIGNILGQGAFGIVYQGKWQQGDVAIKQLLLTQLTYEAMNDFKNEAAVMKTLRHPNVIEFYGASMNVPGKYSLVMQLMPMGSLFDVLHNGQPLDWKTRANIAMDITAGLEHLHSKDILHRDLKSLNVLLGYGMRARLTDFGLAKVKSQARSTGTLANSPKGTIAWMAPEQFKRKSEYSAKTDIYSYGMILWELASRKIPYADAANSELIMQWIKDGEQEDISQECPDSIAKLIRWCWQAEPNNRPTTQQAAIDLQRFHDDLDKDMRSLQENLDTSFGMK